MTLHILLPVQQVLLCFSNIASSHIGPFQKTAVLKPCYDGRSKSLSEISAVTQCNTLGRNEKRGRQRAEIRGKYKQHLGRTTSEQKRGLLGQYQSPLYLSSAFAVGNMMLEDRLSQAPSLALTHHALLVSTTVIRELLEDRYILERGRRKNNNSVVSQML